MPTDKNAALAKYNLKNALLLKLYNPSSKAFTKECEDLVLQNNVLKGVHASSFLYRGTTYPVLQKLGLKSSYALHPSLEEKFVTVLYPFDEIQKFEVPLVAGFIIHVLNSSDCWEDYLKVFPETLHPLIEEWWFHFKWKIPTLTEAAIADILDKHSKGLQLLRARLVWNLLS